MIKKTIALCVLVIVLVSGCSGQSQQTIKSDESRTLSAIRQEQAEYSEPEVNFFDYRIGWKDKKTGDPSILYDLSREGNFKSFADLPYGDNLILFDLVPKPGAWQWLAKQVAGANDIVDYHHKLYQACLQMSKWSNKELSRKFDIYVFYTPKKYYTKISSLGNAELGYPFIKYLYYLDFEQNKQVKIDSIIVATHDAWDKMRQREIGIIDNKLSESTWKYLEFLKESKFNFESVTDFVPFNYKIDMQAEGDTNLDDVKDVAIVLRNIEDDGYNERTRPVLVLSGQLDYTYVLDKISWTAVAPKYQRVGGGGRMVKYTKESISIDSIGTLQYHATINFDPKINK